MDPGHPDTGTGSAPPAAESGTAHALPCVSGEHTERGALSFLHEKKPPKAGGLCFVLSLFCVLRAPGFPDHVDADLDLSVLPSVGLIGIAYLLLRCIGKWGGTYLGAVCVKADKHIRHYLGLTLLPQAGVAIGMAALVSARFPTLAAQVNTIVLAGVLVFELVGPVITKMALTKAGGCALHDL